MFYIGNFFLFAGGLLLKAAEELNDEAILVDLRGKDHVAIEVRYHRSCYRDYTGFLTQKNPNKPDGNREYMSYSSNKAFEVFCTDIVEERIIQRKQIYRMVTLQELFIKTVRKVENLDDTVNIRASYLKQKLKPRFPSLQFVQPTRRNASEIVFCKDGTSLLADRWASESSECETTDAELGSEEDQPQVTPNFGLESRRNLYLAGQQLQGLVSDTPTLSVWPPTADDIKESAKKIIPPRLFNFLAWITGVSDAIEFDNFLETDDDTERKLLSIAQDIVYLSSKGRKTMPKHVALGMTLRHMTGSSSIIGILNGLGHSASHSAVLQHDTALANKQLACDTIIPEGFRKKVPTTVIWDNNDFMEETPSGEGTTHNTNGLLCQRAMEMDDDNEASTNSQNGSKKKAKDRRRSVDPPPNILEVYHKQKRQGPSPINNDQSVITDPATDTHLQYKQSLDSVYCLSKIQEVEGTLHPGWTEYNTLLSFDVIPPLSKLGYLPVIDASPTKMDTVYTILKQSVDIADSLELDSLVLVMDQAIYAKAQHIRWQSDSFQERLVIRLGDFHTSMSYMGTIGKRFQGSGLDDVLFEAEIVAPGSISGVLSGHHYNRSIRAHKLMYEALQRLRWAAYLDASNTTECDAVLDVVRELNDAGPTMMLYDVIQHDRFKTTVEKYESFVEKRRAENPTFDYWSSYIDMVQGLLLFQRGTREGDWELHLSSLRQLLPWFFAYDRMNYARYLPAYISEMERLPESHPTIYNSFLEGEFVIQRQDRYGFSQIACDLAIEQTCNRDSKTNGGMKGLTLNKGAVNRWLLSHHHRAAIMKECKLMAGRDENERSRKDLDVARMERDEKILQNLVATIQSMVNPFLYEGEDLISISSGCVAPKDTKDDLTGAYNIGRSCAEAFVETRMKCETDKIFLPIKTNKLKTFSTIGKTSISKTKCETLSLKTTSDMFNRLLIIGRTREVDLKELLSYALMPVPMSLGTSDGTPCKTVKAKLMHEIEKDVEPLAQIPAGTALIVDGMAFIQQIYTVPSTFGELADKLLEDLLKMALRYKCCRVDFVCDRYPVQSIKNCERDRRAVGGTQVFKITRQDQKTPKQFKKFLASGENKECLVEFLFQCWSKCDPGKLADISLIVSHGEACHSLKVIENALEVQRISELFSDHEEADTRLLLHARHAAQVFSTVVIKSPDTDVMILSVAKSHDFHECVLLFLTGTGIDNRIINITEVGMKLGREKCQGILGLHIFTGCDSVSAFKGKGKIKPLGLMLESDTFCSAFMALGCTWEVSDDILPAIEKFVCTLYGQKDSPCVNVARYNLFRLTCKSDQALPPNQDCLKHHLNRANYQTAIHRRCLEQYIHAPSPVGHGWKMENGQLSYKWMSDSPAPPAVLKNVHCRCRKGGCKGACSCAKGGLPCTELCQCVPDLCENQASKKAVATESDSDTSESDSDISDED